MPGTRKLGRAAAHRNAILRAMVTFLLDNGKIETTVSRAKEVSAMAFSFITKEDVVNKLFKEIAPKYADRNGGYTRITKLGPRRGDAAEMAVIELV